MFQHIHTRPKPLDTELVTQQTCSNQQVIINSRHINTITINQTYKTPYTSLYLHNIYNMCLKHDIKLKHMYMTRRSNSGVMANWETIAVYFTRRLPVVQANLLTQSSRQKMETESSTEMLVATYQTAHCYNPKDNNLKFHRHENFRSCPSTAHDFLIMFK
jgi:hypothetical protein